MEITPESLDRIKDLLYENILFSQHGQGSNKKLCVVTDPFTKRVWYKVVDHCQPIYEGPDMNIAAIVYNKSK